MRLFRKIYSGGIKSSTWLSLFFGVLFAISTSLLAEEKNSDDNTGDALRSISYVLRQEYQQKKSRALEFADSVSIPLRKEFGDGRIIELQYIDKKGFPVYFTTNNTEAATIVGTDQLYPGGEIGVSLTGRGFSAGIWDAGVVDSAHLEFGERVIVKNEYDEPDVHATHVGGTIIASGDNERARGMAYEAGLISYDWNDYLSEVAEEAAGGMYLSNQSWGLALGWQIDENGDWKWYGPSNADYDYRFGFYSGAQSYNLDNIAYLSPELLMVWSAGNDRNGVGDGTREPNGPYNCIGPYPIAKNVLSVGAVKKINGKYTGPGDVEMTDFSSWGPSDDGRIKPDIVAPGADIISTYPNDGYMIASGTSMSAPVVSGSLLLLQELYSNLYGGVMMASTLKALVIHSAFDTGKSRGPDYEYGWGMLNTLGAAELILESESSQGVYLKELTLNQNDTLTFDFYSDGISDITATMVWTDPPGSPVLPDSSDLTRLMLKNDLDIRIVNQAGDIYYPWILDPANPEEVATTGDNYRDNVEKILISNPEPRLYTVMITHKGELLDESQDFSLILSASVIDSDESNTLYRTGGGGEWNDPLHWSLTSGGEPAGIVPDENYDVVIDENSFKTGSGDLVISHDARCRSFRWLAKDESGIDFGGNNIYVYGDFMISEGIALINDPGYFVFRGERAKINTGINSGVFYPFFFDNETGVWDILSEISIDKMVVKSGTINFSGKDVHLNTVEYTGDLPAHLDFSGSAVYLYDKMDLTGVGFTFEVENTQIFIEPDDHDKEVYLIADHPDFAVIDVKSGRLILEGDMNIELLSNSSAILLNGDNMIDTLILEGGSGTYLKGGSTQFVTDIQINSDADNLVHISAANDQPATINVDLYVKFCFDYLVVSDVSAAGDAVFGAGQNSTLTGETAGWVEGDCKEVLFARFEVEFACVGGFTMFTDKSDGNIDTWSWNFGDHGGVGNLSDLQNPYYTYDIPGDYNVSLKVTDSRGEISVEETIEIEENTIPGNEIFINMFDVLVSTESAPNYQWYHNGVPLPGANMRTFNPGDLVGEISVLLWDETCSRISNTLVVSTPDVSIEEDSYIIYPNPAEDYININFSDPYTGTVLFEIIDPSGKTVYSYTSEKSYFEMNTTFNVSGFSPGVYLIRAIFADKTVVKSFMKI